MDFYCSPVLAIDTDSVFWLFFGGIMQTVLSLAVFGFLLYLFCTRKQRKAQRMLNKAFTYKEKGLFEKAYIQHLRYMELVGVTVDDYYRTGVFCEEGEKAGWTPPGTKATSLHWYELAAQEGHVWARFIVAKKRFQESFPDDLLACAKVIDEIKSLRAEGVSEADDYLQKTGKYLEEQTKQKRIRISDKAAILDGEEYWHLNGKLLLNEGKTKEGLAWLFMAAEKGYAMACSTCGNVYQKGVYGVPCDMEKAIHWYEKAAECGDETDICYLAQLYTEGEICEKDLLKAAEWFAKAGDKGMAEAFWNAGVCYYKYAKEWADQKGLTDEQAQSEKEYQLYILLAAACTKKAEEKGYKPKAE